MARRAGSSSLLAACSWIMRPRRLAQGGNAASRQEDARGEARKYAGLSVRRRWCGKDWWDAGRDEGWESLSGFFIGLVL